MNVIPSYSPDGDSFIEMMDNAKIRYRISDFIKQIDILNTEGRWESAWNETRKNQFR